MSTTPQSPFLDILPPELRLTIYEHLLVTPFPLKGPSARLNQNYNLHTSILRVNKQIHAEARSIFFGKNTFYITSSIPPRIQEREGGHEEEVEQEGSGAFEPPLQLACLPLVRHLTLDLLYYPTTTTTTTTQTHTALQTRPRSRSTCDASEYFRSSSSSSVGGATGAKKTTDNKHPPRCIGAERYVTSLSYLLNAVTDTLLSLRFCADVRRYTSTTLTTTTTTPLPTPAFKPRNLDIDNLEDDDDDEDDTLDIPSLLTGFHAADTSLWFKAALANLSSLNTIPLRFDFPESYFNFSVERALLVKGSLVFLAGQVLFARSEIRLKALMEELGDEEEGEGEGGGEEGGFGYGYGYGESWEEEGSGLVVDLPGKVMLGVEGRGTRAVERKGSC